MTSLTTLLWRHHRSVYGNDGCLPAHSRWDHRSRDGHIQVYVRNSLAIFCYRWGSSLFFFHTIFLSPPYHFFKYYISISISISFIYLSGTFFKRKYLYPSFFPTPTSIRAYPRYQLHLFLGTSIIQLSFLPPARVPWLYACKAGLLNPLPVV